MKCNWNTYSVQELIDRDMLEPPMDGNHGGSHPKTSDYVSFGVPFIMANNLVNGLVDYKHCAYISEEQAKTLRKGFAKPGDVLLTHKATIGRTAIVSDEYSTTILTPQITYYRVKKGISNRYLKYYFDTPAFQNTFANWAGSGSTRSYLGITAQRKLPITLPPFEIQHKIASILGTFDDKIELNNAINNNLEQQAQAIFKSWFVDFEPFGGVIPNDWKQTKLGDSCNCILGGTPSRNKSEYWNGSIPWINSGEVNKFRIIKPSETITNLGLEKSATKLLPAKTTVLAITGATLGQVSLLEIDACANQSVVGIIPNDNLPYEYIYPLIKQNIAELISHQTGGAQQHINKQNVENLDIVIPAYTHLMKYQNTVCGIYEMIANNCFENDRLSSVRDTLLPKLMSGELDVSNIKI